MRKTKGLGLVFVLLVAPAFSACTGGETMGDGDAAGGWQFGGVGADDDTGRRAEDDTVETDARGVGGGMDTVVVRDSDDGREDPSERDTRIDREDGGIDTGVVDTGRTCTYDDSVPIRGVVKLHSATSRVSANETVEGLEVGLVRAVAWASGRSRHLRTGDCGEARKTLSATGAEDMYYFEDVDVSDVSRAVLAIVDDAPPAGRDDFIETVTGVAEASRLSRPVTGYPAWAVSRAVEAEVAEAAGLQAGELERRGFLIGKVVEAGRRSVAGLKVFEHGDATPIPHAIYPTEDLSGTRGSTSKSGIFIVPDADLDRYVMRDTEGNPVSSLEEGLSRPGSAFAMTLEYQ